MASHCVAGPWRRQQLTKKLEADSRNPCTSLAHEALRALDIDFRTTRPRTAEPHVSPVNRNECFLGALRADQFSTESGYLLLGYC